MKILVNYAIMEYTKVPTSLKLNVTFWVENGGKLLDLLHYNQIPK